MCHKNSKVFALLHLSYFHPTVVLLFALPFPFLCTYLQTSLATIEDKLVQSESEVTHLRANLRQYEALVEEYRSQVSHTKM